jgi:glutaredoxin 3
VAPAGTAATRREGATVPDPAPIDHPPSVEMLIVGIPARPLSLREVMAAEITLYCTDWCGYCERAKALLRQRGLAFDEIRLDGEPAFRERLYELTGGWTVPQVVIDGRPIGGYLELWRLDREGELERLAA